MTRLLPQASAKGLAVNRRHALGAFAALAGGMAAGAPVAAEPAPSDMVARIAAWKNAAAAYTAAADWQNNLKQQHSDIREYWPRVSTGITESSFHSFGMGIDLEFAQQAARLRNAFSERAEVERALEALDKLRAIARADLDTAEAAYRSNLEAVGIAQAERDADAAAKAEYQAFAAILACEPASAEEAALRSWVLLELVTSCPADPKVSQIREALFS